MENNSQFGAWWPDVERTIRAMLTGRRTDPADIDDIVQLTAERALKTQVRLETEKAFGRWCTTVAKNLFVDEYRRASRYQRAEMPEQVDRWNPEDVVVAREIRPDVERLLDTLTDREGWAFNWDGPRPEDPRLRNQFNVALHRAVKRLEQGYGELSVVALCGLARFRDRFRSSGQASAVAAAGVAVAFAALVAVEADDSRNHHHDQHSTESFVAAQTWSSSRQRDGRVAAHLAAAPLGLAEPSARRSAPIPRITIPLPKYDGHRHDVVIRPTEEQDEGNLFCGGHTAVTPFFCVKSPAPSVDTFLPPAEPS